MRNYRSLFKSGGKVIPFAILLLLFSFTAAWSQVNHGDYTDENFKESCTSIIVGKLATADGSTMTAHTCDANYRTWFDIQPHKTDIEEKMVGIFKGLMHNRFAGDLRNIKKLGEIPQVKETYKFFNTAYPAMNEYQLAIGETTFGGKRELRSKEGIFQIEELERIALERCKTAREAIKLIGGLAEKYGYNDGGECLTFADKKEVWQFEILGPGKNEDGTGRLGATWAAKRIPDDHVGISANICRIPEIDLKDPDNYMASKNVHSLAIEKGWWDKEGGEPFKFWEAYSGRKPFNIREFWVLSNLAPSLNLQFDAEELPFSVKPEKKVSIQDMFKFYKATYEGTEYDMTQNLKVKNRRTQKMQVSPVANPWMSRYMIQLLNNLKPGSVRRHRPIAVQYCAYHTILQCRDWLPDEIGGLMWFGFDNPAHTPKAPVFVGITELPPGFAIGSQEKFRTDSDAWAYRRASRLAMIRWDRAKKTIQETIKGFEDKALSELPEVEKKALALYKEDPEKAKAYLTSYTNAFFNSMTKTYWDLGDKFWNFYNFGF